MTITMRYGPKPESARRNREVEATAVSAWATSLTVIYETDPQRIAAVLPPPLEPASAPLVRAINSLHDGVELRL